MFNRSRLPSIQAKELMEKITKKEELTLLDVRKPREWAQTGVIPGSIMIEMQTLPREIQSGLNLKDKEPIVVVCRTGKRSSSIVKYLIEQLNINAINLEGGVVSWHRNGGKFEHI
ncbi:MAG: rhodanese-like domain-containing protein [Candidatus Heimdallarchaeota archaeon]